MAPARPAFPLWHVVTALAAVGTLAVHRGTVDAAPRAGAAAASRSGDGSETYRGDRIEMGPDVPNAELAQRRRAAEHQVDLVEATVLDASTKAFLRRFPLVAQTGASAGSHYSGGKRNPDILTDDERAREGGFDPAGADVLKNPGEFFAMTASVYLHGRLAREPFTREELRQKQPVYFGHLNRLFGSPRAASSEALQTSGPARPWHRLSDRTFRLRPQASR